VLILLVDFIANGHTGGEGIKLMEFDMQTNLRTKPSRWVVSVINTD